MQIKIKRAQRKAGLMGRTLFMLDIRSEYSQEERDRINKYDLGGEVIYNSAAAKKHLDAMDSKGLFGAAVSLALAKANLNVTISSLQKGHHIECADLQELLGAEDQLIEACKKLKNYLEVAASFDGREEVVNLDDGMAA